MSIQEQTTVVGQETVQMGMTPNNESQLRSHSDRYNAGARSKQQIHEEHNSGHNLETIKKLFAAGRARDIEDEPKKEKEPVFIIGSGPSLDVSAPMLKDWRGGIICSSSHARTLVYYGAPPTHIVCLDPFDSWADFEGVDWSKYDTKLVTHPGVWPDLLKNWPNDVLLYRQNMGRSDSFYATTQRNMYSMRDGDRNKATFNFMIRTEIVVFACSPPMQLFVSDRLGYGMPFLAGIDFSYHSGKSRFTSYTVKKPAGLVQAGNAAPVDIPAEWEAHESPFDDTKPDSELIKNNNKLVKTDNGQYSDYVTLYYKKNMISAWRLLGRTIYSTDSGAITEMPHISPLKAIQSQGRKAKERSPEWNRKTADRYLARVGAFVVEAENGAMNFIESEDPEVQIHQWMVNMTRQYQCELCGSIGMAEDSKLHNGETCPVCKQGKLQRRHNVDIEKNMARIRKLLEWVEKHGGAQTQFNLRSPAQNGIAPAAGAASNSQPVEWQDPLAPKST